MVIDAHSLFFILFFFYIRENDPGWDIDIQDDVIEECNKHGGVVHIYVDKNSAQVRFAKIFIAMF